MGYDKDSYKNGPFDREARKAPACHAPLILEQPVEDVNCFVYPTWDEDPELICVPLRKEEFAIIVRPDSPYRHLPELSIQDLAHARFILTEEGCTYRAHLLHTLRQSATPHQIVCAFGSLEAIKQCVMCDLGISFLPCVTVQEEIAQGKLLAIPFIHESHLSTQVIYLQSKWQSQAFQCLLDLMAQGAQP